MSTTCCNMMQHTATNCKHAATHCNALQGTQYRCVPVNCLQHTATCCNTLQHAATCYNTQQRTATHCNTLQHTTTHSKAAHCNPLQHTQYECAPVSCCASVSAADSASGASPSTTFICCSGVAGIHINVVMIYINVVDGLVSYSF